MHKSSLFKPIRTRDLELANRIVIAPMCQYSAQDGCMNDWHLIHFGQLAMSGAAQPVPEVPARTFPKFAVE
jgi:2,4-dienoyl-CoA reductase-like NADH-dependent reductase (Old Yellow Enzyme family)